MWAILATVICVLIIINMIFMYITSYKGIINRNKFLHIANNKIKEPRYLMAYIKLRQLRMMKTPLLLGKAFYPSDIKPKKLPKVRCQINFLSKRTIYDSCIVFRNCDGEYYTLSITQFEKPFLRYLYCVLMQGVSENHIKSLYYFKSLIGNQNIYSHYAECFGQNFEMHEINLCSLINKVEENLHNENQEIIFMFYNNIINNLYRTDDSSHKKHYKRRSNEILLQFGLIQDIEFYDYNNLLSIIIFLIETKYQYLTYS